MAILGIICNGASLVSQKEKGWNERLQASYYPTNIADLEGKKIDLNQQCVQESSCPTFKFTLLIKHCVDTIFQMPLLEPFRWLISQCLACC